MNKLRLNVEALAVESFPTDNVTGSFGTVRARDNTEFCPAGTQGGEYTCQLGCVYTLYPQSPVSCGALTPYGACAHGGTTVFTEIETCQATCAEFGVTNEYDCDNDPTDPTG